MFCDQPWPIVAEHQLVGHEDVVEHDLAEVGRAVDERDRGGLHARRFQVDDQLAEALALVGDLVTRGRTTQHDDPVVLVGRCRPDLATVEHPPVTVTNGLRRDRRQITATVGLAHADAERQLAAADAREEALLLLLGAELGEHRARLPVGHPMMPDRGAPAQQLLDDDEAVDRRAIVAPVLLGQGHAQPATPAELARELGVLRRVHAEPGRERATWKFAREEPDDVASQLALGGRQLDRPEVDHDRTLRCAR